MNIRSKDKDGGDIFDEERDHDSDESEDKKNAPNEQKKDEMLKKLCFLCENPKCTYHCKGFCKRVFHTECRKKV